MIDELKPYQWQKCPKCDGQGIVSKPSWIAGDQNEWSSSASSYTCDVCKGAKIIQSFPPDLIRKSEVVEMLKCLIKNRIPGIYTQAITDAIAKLEEK